MFLKKLMILIPLATAALSVLAMPSRFAIYVARHKQKAIENMKRTGIPASITLAQGAHESQNGDSHLAKIAHNHFGVKKHNGNGYKRYANADQSFDDHANIIKKQKRYAPLFGYAETDYKAWAYGLYKAGYATDKQYPQKIIRLIEKYQLYKIDQQVLFIGTFNKLYFM